MKAGDGARDRWRDAMADWLVGEIEQFRLPACIFKELNWYAGDVMRQHALQRIPDIVLPINDQGIGHSVSFASSIIGIGKPLPFSLDCPAGRARLTQCDGC